jgi:hypothetical protein
MQKKIQQRDSIEYHENCYQYYLAAVNKYRAPAVRQRVQQNADFHKRHLDALRAKSS